MKILSFVIILICYQCTLIDSYRILGIFQHPGSSHFIIFRPLLERLAEVGHDVTVISHFARKDPPKNYKDIDLYGTIPIWKSAFLFDNFTFFQPLERIMIHTKTAALLTGMGNDCCKAMMQHKQVQSLKKGDFDVIVLEEFNSDCALGLVHKLDIPFVYITSHVLMAWSYDKLGILTNPSYVVNHHLGHGRHPDVLGALENLLVATYYKWYYYYNSEMYTRKILQEYLDKDIPSLETIAKNASMVLVNSYFALNGANPVPQNFIEIGGIHHVQPKELPKDIKDYLDSASNGAILFSMGSMLQATSWPKEKIKVFQKVFSELPQKVIWKWENDTMEGRPDNVKIIKWIPQYDILHHENVKVFITHSGMLGLSEAIKWGVPALTIPIFGDQFCNAEAMQESGSGIYMKYRNISEESIRWALKTLLEPRMKANAERLAALWNDRPMSPLDTAVYWIEHVARHGGSHLQPPYKDLPLYRYLLLDVFAILISTILAVIFVTKKILKTILKAFMKVTSSKTNKKND